MFETRETCGLAAYPDFGGHLHTGHLYMQRARQGKVHHVWEEMADEAGAAPMIRFNFVGNRGVAVVAPAAVAALLKKPKFVRKAPGVYDVFKFGVRCTCSV